jgi:2-polyprenyl-3-methyl-5-hydroxy-6-metoxy-1,4-benzoquinol methylase
MENSKIMPFERFTEEVADFEGAVLGQKPLEASHYDNDYFASEWRDAGNRYELETRRRIEARNPELVMEVFAPERILDVGCGPGFLMLFLHELGANIHGIDFSPASVDLAPPEIKDRIAIGPTDRLPFPDGAFDLVICREVMEHLTILQVRRTVAETCRVSSKYVYMTTRFHPDPQSLLAHTTDFETDPTHITLLSKDLLRTLFILEGFRRVELLEQRMDWARKGRVLVYERAVA